MIARKAGSYKYSAANFSETCQRRDASSGFLPWMLIFAGFKGWFCVFMFLNLGMESMIQNTFYNGLGKACFDADVLRL